ncbi:MAG: zf-HC2 domain-containing protein, partial [Ktedonobacterales bacterium]
MNCEQAEDILSAYLDNNIDPPQRSEFEGHLAGCAECSATLAEYRRFDAMLRAEPRVAPADSLRARIFESDEFAGILRSLDHDDEHDDAGRPTPTVGSGRRRATASWSRRGLQIAAVLALTLGSALLVTQGLLHSSPSGRRSQPLTISGTGQQAPLAAGNRVVYLRDATLWSAPRNGPGIAQRLTPSGTRVAGWAVAPNGQTLAYIDARTGEIHVIRADGQSDQLVGAAAVAPTATGFWSSAAGLAVRGGLAWSPNGEQIAYLAASDEHSTTLRVMNADGTNDRAADSASGAMFGAPVWSADSLRVAYTFTSHGAQNLCAYNEDLQSTRLLAAR